jgi:hypothetical protein
VGDRATVRARAFTCDVSRANGSTLQSTASRAERTARPPSERLGKRVDGRAGATQRGAVKPVLLCLTLGLALCPGESGARTDSGATVTRQWSQPSREHPRSLRRWFEGLPAGLQYSAVRVRAGDDPRWAEAAWDDADWEVKGVWGLPARAGVRWVRFRVRMGEDGQAVLPGGIMISTVRAYEVFWDGVLVGGSGVPGESPETEKVGRVDEWFGIPAALRGPGEHVVAIRTSSFRVGFPAATSGLRFLVDDPAKLQGLVLREAFVPTLAAGALCMVAMAALILWLFAARRATLLLLAGLCLAAAAMQTLQAVRWFFPYPADWHRPVLATMIGLVGVQGFLTVALVIEHFAVARRWWLLGGFILVSALAAWLSPERMNLEGVWILAAGMAVSLACAGWAAWRRRRGAWPVIIGVGASALLLLLEAEDFRASFFVKFLPALVGLIVALALRIHDERREAQAAQLTSARLEVELLKKNIQPHFLMNTLAVITEIIERDPPAAVQLVADLAEEFRTVARVSAEKLVSLGQELGLCRTHLRVMSVRTGRSWILETEGADDAAMVPPAVFLTLIENGFAHQRVSAGAASFRLKMERPTTGATRYTFVSPGEVQTGEERPAGGTGLRYVRARLEESFPGSWTLTGEPGGGGWRTVIEIGAAPDRRRS